MGVLNVGGYFDPLIALLDHGVVQQFVRPENRGLLSVSDEPESLVADLMTYAGDRSLPQKIDLGNW